MEISLLGRFQAKIDGVAVEEKNWGRRSARSLVKLLALRPFHALHREQIMDLLWTEESPETASNNLNKAIYGARRALEPDLVKGTQSRFILTRKQVILESPGSLSVDLDELGRLANYALQNNDIETGQKAVELYRGDLLIEEAGVSSGIQYLSYIRNIDGSATKLIGDGAPIAFSPDEKLALVRIPNPNNRLSLKNIETKEVKTLETDSENSLIYQEYVCFFPDGKRVMFPANKLDSGTMLYMQNIDGGSPVCLTLEVEGISIESQCSISSDDEFIVLKNAENKQSLYRISDGTFSPLKNLEDSFSMISWSGDSKFIYIRRRGELPTIVYKYELATQAKEIRLKLKPRDAAGVNEIINIQLTPDGKTYAYSFKRELSDLYLMEDF